MTMREKQFLARAIKIVDNYNEENIILNSLKIHNDVRVTFSFQIKLSYL